MSPSHELFGRRSPPHTLVLARGDKVRHWTIRPWLWASVAGVVSLSVLTAAGVGAVYMLGGDVVAAVQQREAHATAIYERRIADLRRQIDRITTRQVIDRESVSREVEDLLREHRKLTERFTLLEPVLDKATEMGVPLPEAAPVRDAPQPLVPADLLRSSFEDVVSLPSDDEKIARIADEILPTIRRSVDLVAEQQTSRIDTMARDAQTRAEAINRALGAAGLREQTDDSATGGPFVAAANGDGFARALDELDQSLGLLERLRSRTDRLPIADPMPGGRMTSAFGVRADPFEHEEAVHSGMDFAIAAGTPVHPTAQGRVVSAGYAGGYGLMVEVDHGDGLSTRYGHMSRIDVAVGDDVTPGTTIGRVGSTGRSTGPHLHYEVREGDKAVNPARYIRAGRTIAAL